jgi:hypothetical protein
VKGQFHLFPDMYFGLGRTGIEEGNQPQDWEQGFHNGILWNKTENVKLEAPIPDKRLPKAQNFCTLPVI